MRALPEQRCRVFGTRVAWTTGARDGLRGMLEALPPIVAALFVAEDWLFGPTASAGAREANFRPAQPGAGWARRCGGRRCVTPRQTCPRPNGLGRNLRSKTRWFTGFCNSHQVSHFATFFIDARAEISVAESRFRFSINQARVAAEAPRPGRLPNALFVRVPWRGSRRGFVD